MTAKDSQRFSIKKRTDLSQAIPLDTPLVLFIDPSSTCNFLCHFCPCSTRNRGNWNAHKKTGTMRYELFRKIVDDAQDFPQRIKTLRLYKEGEPLLNKRLSDMIHYAKKKDIAEKIDFTTNGSLLTPDLGLALVDAGLDRIVFSIEALTQEGYKATSGVNQDPRKIRDNIEFLFKNRQGCRIFVKTTDQGLGDHSPDDFKNMFGDICDEISIEHVAPVWPGSGLGDNARSIGLYGNEVQEHLVCPYIFYSICVNSDGSTSACLMDWNHELLVGNAESDSIVDIWKSDNMQRMRIAHLQGLRKENPTCAQCGQMSYATIDNIDAAREELLKRILDKSN